MQLLEDKKDFIVSDKEENNQKNKSQKENVNFSKLSIYDSKAATLLMQALKNLCSSVKTIIADGGYRGQVAENIRDTFGYVLLVVISGYKKTRF